MIGTNCWTHSYLHTQSALFLTFVWLLGLQLDMFTQLQVSQVGKLGTHVQILQRSFKHNYICHAKSSADEGWNTVQYSFDMHMQLVLISSNLCRGGQTLADRGVECSTIFICYATCADEVKLLR